MIYVLQVDDYRFIKVGFCEEGNLEKRIASLQTGCPYPIKLVGSVPGTISQEQSLHDSLRRAFARIRIPICGNEWYPGRQQWPRQFVAELLSGGFDAAFAFSGKYHENVKQPGAKGGDTSSVNLMQNQKRKRKRRRKNHPGSGANTSWASPT